MLRLLLDQNFPEPPGFDIGTLDASVEYEHIRSFDPSLILAGTPDWFIYLRAHAAGFDGLVTRDWHQSGQAEEMVALAATNLTVITWRKPIEDSIVEWGQLLAYMPQIQKLMKAHPKTVIFLPQPSLDRSNTTSATEAIGLLAVEQDISNAQVRRDARDAILRELDRRGLRDEFEPLLVRAPRRPRSGRRG